MTNQAAIYFLRARESCRLNAYWDALGKRWTIGWGATGPGIVANIEWTQEQADADLEHRVALIDAEVGRLLGVGSFTAWQRAALISFEYNTGELANSHLLQFVLKRNWLEAAKAFLQWDHCEGTEIQGLLKRRLLEAALFLDGV